MDSSAGRKIALNLSWLGLQEVVARLLGFVAVIYLARLLPPTDYGSLNICLALMAVLTLLVRAGTGSRATRLTARDTTAIARLHSEVAGLRIVIAVILTAIVCLLAEPLGRLLSVPAPLLMLGSALLIRPALTVAWAFRGTDNMRPIALAVMAERLIVLAGILAFVHGRNMDMYTVVMLEILGGMVVVIWLRRVLTRRLGSKLPLQFNYRQWGGMIRESGPVSMAAIIGSLYRHGDVLLLGILADSATAAVYMVGQKIVITLALLPSLAGKASFPSTSRLIHHDPAASVALQARLLRLSLALILPVCAIAMIFSAPLLGLLFGQQYVHAENLLRVLLLTLPFYTFSIYQENLLLAAPKPKALLACRLVSSIAHVLLAVMLIPQFGATGAAIGCLAGQLVFALGAAAVWHSVHAGLPIDARCLVPLAATIAAIVLFQVADSADLWLRVIIGLISYIALLIVFRGLQANELKSLVSYIRKSMHAGRDAA